MKTNSSIGKRYRKSESFSFGKFLSGLNPFNLVLWSKTFSHTVRVLVIGLIVFGAIFSYGYFKGVKHKPIFVHLKHGQEITMKLNGNFLHIDREGQVWVEDKKGNKIKRIKVSDIPELKKALSPFGWQLKPIGIIGGAIGEDGIGAEGGIGISFLRAWRTRLDTFLTQKGVYLGISYKLDQIGLKNTTIGFAPGKGYKKGENRFIAYIRWLF